MKLDFSTKTMEIGTFQFNLVRTMMVAATGGAELNECLLVAGRIKDNDEKGRVREWAAWRRRHVRPPTGRCGRGRS